MYLVCLPNGVTGRTVEVLTRVKGSNELFQSLVISSSVNLYILPLSKLLPLTQPIFKDGCHC